MRHLFFGGRIVWLMAVVGLCVAVGCRSRKGDSILPQKSVIKEGDVVFRRGCGLTSRAVITIDRGGAYSHVGIAVDSAGVIMIVHAVPGEPDFEGDKDRVKIDLPEVFFNHIKARKGEIHSHRDSLAAKRAAKIALEVYRRGTLFDHDYDDKDTTKMYCTELIVFAYDRAGAPLSAIKHHSLSFLSTRAECVLPSDILECEELILTNKF